MVKVQRHSARGEKQVAERPAEGLELHGSVGTPPRIESDWPTGGGTNVS